MARLPHDTPEGLFHFGEPAPVVERPPAATETWLHPRGGAKPGETVLITGIAGGQGRLIARRLANTFDLVGVDRTYWEGHPPGLRVHKVDIRKRKFEDIFRTERPSAVVHLAFIRHFRGDAETRHEVNVLGTKRLLEYAIAHGVKRVVVLSSSYVYGALPDNPYYMDEDSPLNVSRNYPEVRDLAEVDTLATGFLWRHPEIATTIIRPVNTLGYYVHSAIGRYLRQRYVPSIMGFNPMMQFIHEEDVAEAFVRALERGARGVFNVVGPGAVPLSVAIRETGGTSVPLPETVARRALDRLFRFGLFPVPADAVDFVKFPCTIDGRRFHEATEFRPLFTLEETLLSVRR